MAADPTLERAHFRPRGRWRLSRLPPAGQPLALDTLGWLLRGGAGSRTASLERMLAERLNAGGVTGSVTLHRSGRAALVAVFRRLAERSGRDEIVVPAYTCYSVPAAAVAAGLRVRLVDVDEGGRIDLQKLADVPLESAAAVVVSNLFGLPEPVDELKSIAHARGCAVVDDAAQALGARDDGGAVGTRGDAGIMSFGRGKPVSALGGGAAWWPANEEPFERGGAAGAVLEPATATADLAPIRISAFAAVARVLAYELALVGPVFRALAAVPALHIGETIYDTDIETGAVAAESRALLDVALGVADRDANVRRAEARRLAALVAAETAYRPLLAASHATGVYPRLALLAPGRGARDASLAALERIGAGASRMYPDSLDAVSGLRSHRVDSTPMPTASRLAARLITLPTHGRLRGRRLDETLAVLAKAGR